MHASIMQSFERNAFGHTRLTAVHRFCTRLPGSWNLTRKHVTHDNDSMGCLPLVDRTVLHVADAYEYQTVCTDLISCYGVTAQEPIRSCDAMQSNALKQPAIHTNLDLTDLDEVPHTAGILFPVLWQVCSDRNFGILCQICSDHNFGMQPSPHEKA